MAYVPGSRRKTRCSAEVAIDKVVNAAAITTVATHGQAGPVDADGLHRRTPDTARAGTTTEGSRLHGGSGRSVSASAADGSVASPLPVTGPPPGAARRNHPAGTSQRNPFHVAAGRAGPALRRR